MQKCIMCGKDSKWKFCYPCRDKRNYMAATVSMAKKRLSKILKQKDINKEWIQKIQTQSERIIKYGSEILKYK